jgi:hypothetical protein
MLVGLMVAAPAAFASDFVTGVVVGQCSQMLFRQQEGREHHLRVKRPADYHDGQPVVTRGRPLKNNKWRKQDGPQGGYFVCPGEYRSYAEGCVVASMMMGFNGFVGVDD